VQAPQSPSAQPSFVPVSRFVILKKSSKVSLRNSQKIKQSLLRANSVKPHILTIQQKSDLVSRQRHGVTFPKTSCAEFTPV